jgi:ABC-type transport system involved in cytochrome bd biosynthesis fused ATPase/permease subunit
MILDEGTNQLDATNELKIMNLLLKNKKDNIIIMISHRMTSLQKADVLFCLEDGIIKDF